MTEQELLGSSKVSLLHSSGYRQRVGSNSPAVVHTYKITFQRKNGDVVVLGTASHANRDTARKLAIADALN